jgi:O-6-methylguanine DNA methyltransferase
LTPEKIMKSKQTSLTSLPIKTADGAFVAQYSDAGLVRLDFPGGGKPIKAAPTTAAMQRWHGGTSRGVRRILAGRPPGKLPPMDLAGAAPFRRLVWAALVRIPRGKTETYGQLAAALSRPKAARAVGGACGANPVPLLIPCHRVVAAGGGLGGFSGGLAWKRKLLALETPRRAANL